MLLNVISANLASSFSLFASGLALLGQSYQRGLGMLGRLSASLIKIALLIDGEDPSHFETWMKPALWSSRVQGKQPLYSFEPRSD